MTKEKFETLENLLGELGQYLGHHSFCIIPGYIQDGYHIAIYDKHGKLIKGESSYDIETAANKILRNPPENYISQIFKKNQQ